MLKHIGIIGDSIAHGYYDEENLGWVARLGQLLLAEHRDFYLFNNMAEEGDNIADATNRAACETALRNFDLIIVSVGINDLRRRKNSDLQLDFSEGARIMYWNKLLNILQKTKAKIIVTDLIPVVEEKYSIEANLVRRNTDVERYNEIIKNICAERQITFFARYQNWIKRDLENLYKDATHPNTEGHRIMAQEIYDFLTSEHML